jgi:DNA-binding FadR family transcriptional regulator
MSDYRTSLLGRADQRVRVPKAAELIAADLRRQVILGDVSAGGALPNESALMERYGVSRPTLREALRILESEGLVSVKRGGRGGVLVQLPDARIAARYAALLLQLRGTTMEDLFVARSVLEPGAVRMLAERRPKSAIRALRAHCDKELSLVDKPDLFATAAAEFHELLVVLAGNETLTLFTQMIIEIVDRHHRATMASSPGTERRLTQKGLEEHARLIHLVAAGEADEAEAFWRAHVSGAAAISLRRLGAKTIVDLLSHQIPGSPVEGGR